MHGIAPWRGVNPNEVVPRDMQSHSRFQVRDSLLLNALAAGSDKAAFSSSNCSVYETGRNAKSEALAHSMPAFGHQQHRPSEARSSELSVTGH
jgi:hypothetical protein